MTNDKQGDAKNVETAALGVARDSLMALVGALSLNKGADVAANFVREKILAESKR